MLHWKDRVVEDLEKLRESIQKDIEEFLERGGVIEELEPTPEIEELKFKENPYGQLLRSAHKGVRMGVK